MKRTLKGLALLICLFECSCSTSYNVPRRLRKQFRLCYDASINNSSFLNTKRIYTISLKLTKQGQNDVSYVDHIVFFDDGLVVINPFIPSNSSYHSLSSSEYCDALHSMDSKALNKFYKQGAWGVYNVSNDTLLIQNFNGNMRMMLSDFYSLSTYTFQIISKDSLKLFKRVDHDDKAGWKVKTTQVTSIHCNHELTSGSAWIKREKWLYCRDR